MKDYWGPFEIEGRYVSDEVWHTSYSVGDQGHTTIQLPLIHPGVHNHRFEILRIRISEGEADAYLEKTLRINELLATNAQLERDLWDERKQREALVKRVAAIESRTDREALEALEPFQMVKELHKRGYPVSEVVSLMIGLLIHDGEPQEDRS